MYRHRIPSANQSPSFPINFVSGHKAVPTSRHKSMNRSWVTMPVRSVGAWTTSAAIAASVGAGRYHSRGASTIGCHPKSGRYRTNFTVRCAPLQPRGG